MQLLKILACSLVVIIFGGCNATDDGSTLKEYSPEAGCSAANIKLWAYENMQDYYLFYDQVPTVNPTVYPSAANLVETLRVQPYDRFSRIAITSEDEEIFDEGKTFGIGAFWLRDDYGRLRVATVYRDSPLGRTTIVRGDKLVSINGVPVENITEDQYQRFVGTRELPRSSTWRFIDARTNRPSDVTLTPSLFDINTVVHSETFEHRHYEGKIGYLVLDAFLGTSEDELDDVIADFRENNIQELILDLRYNGGGFVNVATKLASQIAGPSTDGKLLMDYRHNIKYTSHDFSLDFESVENNLDLRRLVVITSEYTASASELVINALSPYMQVVTIGSRTTGKPYISFGNDLCGQRLHALQAEGFNANDVSVYNGIIPICASYDYLNRDFGYKENELQTENMLLDAVNHVVYGSCRPVSLATTPSLQYDSSQSTSRVNVFAKSPIIGGARMDHLPVKGN